MTEFDDRLRAALDADDEAFLQELDDFPDPGAHDDQVDAAAHGYNFLRPNLKTRVRWLGG